MLRFLSLPLLALCLCHFDASGQAAEVRLTQEMESVALNGAFYFLEDPAASMSLAEAMNSAEFTLADEDNVTLGYSTSALWLRLRVVNDSQNTDWLLQFDYPLLDRIEVYLRYAGGRTHELVMGDLQVFSQRPIAHRNYLVPLGLDPGQSVTVFARVVSKSSMQVRPSIQRGQLFLADQLAIELFFGLIYGVMVLMALYNAFLFVSVRDPAYLGYIFAVVTACIFLMSLNGHAFQYLWPNAPGWANTIVPLSSSLWMIGTALFTQLFLDLKEFARRLWWMMNVMIAIAVVSSLISLFADYRLAIRVSTGMALINGLLILAAGIICWMRGNRAARFFTLAWVVYGFGTMLLITSRFGLLPDNFLTHNSAAIGLLLEIVILSFALSDKYRLMNERLKGYAHKLESKVEERTQELQQANADLKHLSEHDSLTELPNRRNFDLTLKEQWRRHQESGQHIAMLVCDVDEFKQINDFFGHDKGDECLRAVAIILRESAAKPDDLPARLGGDEFAMILPKTEESPALEIAERIARAVEALAFPQAPNANSEYMTVSVGVASIIPNPDNDQEVIFRIADRGTYRSKRAGRNRASIGNYPSDEQASSADSTQSSSDSS